MSTRHPELRPGIAQGQSEATGLSWRLPTPKSPPPGFRQNLDKWPADAAVIGMEKGKVLIEDFLIAYQEALGESVFKSNREIARMAAAALAAEPPRFNHSPRSQNRHGPMIRRGHGSVSAQRCIVRTKRLQATVSLQRVLLPKGSVFKCSVIIGHSSNFEEARQESPRSRIREYGRWRLSTCGASAPACRIVEDAEAITKRHGPDHSRAATSIPAFCTRDVCPRFSDGARKVQNAMGWAI